MSETGYDPNRSKVSEDTMAAWKSSDVTGDLTEVPGIGPAAAKKLCENDGDPITNTWMLIGHYLKLKGPDRVVDGQSTPVGPGELNDRFWHFLKDAGISSHRSAIVKAIGEKVAQSYPGVYDPSIYEEDDDE